MASPGTPVVRHGSYKRAARGPRRLRGRSTRVGSRSPARETRHGTQQEQAEDQAASQAPPAQAPHEAQEGRGQRSLSRRARSATHCGRPTLPPYSSSSKSEISGRSSKHSISAGVASRLCSELACAARASSSAVALDHHVQLAIVLRARDPVEQTARLRAAHLLGQLAQDALELILLTPLRLQQSSHRNHGSPPRSRSRAPLASLHGALRWLRQLIPRGC